MHGLQTGRLRLQLKLQDKPGQVGLGAGQVVVMLEAMWGTKRWAYLEEFELEEF